MQMPDQKSIAKYGLYALIGAAALVVAYVALATSAKAGPGCSLGAGAAHVSGHVDIGGPLNLGVEDQKVVGEVACDANVGKDWMAGIGINYGAPMGDLDDIGLNSDLTVFGRAGPKFGNAWIYGHVGHSWLDTAGGDIDGWKFGIGSESKLVEGQPFYLDMRYSRALYKDALGSGVDIEADEFMALFKYKFEPKQTPLIAPYLDDNTSTGSDSKLMKPKSKR